MTDSQQPQAPLNRPPTSASAADAVYRSKDAASKPGKTLGIVAFVLSFFLSLVGLILGIVALVQSRRSGYKNPWAIAAIIVGGIVLILTIVGFIMAAIFGAQALNTCAELGPGTHAVWGVPFTCNS